MAGVSGLRGFFIHHIKDLLSLEKVRSLRSHGRSLRCGLYQLSLEGVRSLRCLHRSLRCDFVWEDDLPCALHL